MADIRPDEELFFDYGPSFFPAALLADKGGGVGSSLLCPRSALETELEMVAVLAFEEPPAYWLGRVLHRQGPGLHVHWMEQVEVEGEAVWRFVPLQDRVDASTVMLYNVEMRRGPEGWVIGAHCQEWLDQELARVRLDSAGWRQAPPRRPAAPRREGAGPGGRGEGPGGGEGEERYGPLVCEAAGGGPGDVEMREGD